MYGYLAPLLAALVGAFLTALVLGIDRLRRLDRSRAASGVSATDPDSSHDPPGSMLSDLAHSTLDVALLLGLTGIFFFSYAGGAPGAIAVPVAAAVPALLAGWAVMGRGR